MVDWASNEVLVDAQVVSANGVEASGEEASNVEASDEEASDTERGAFPRVASRTCVSSGRRFVRATKRRSVSFTVIGRPPVRTHVGIIPNITTATRGPSKLRSWRKHRSIDGNT
eukprot:379048-Pleurochrysis_carterae.AAC.1